MSCPVCTQALVAEIDANPAHLSLRQQETRYHVSRSSLQRHRHRCQQAAGTVGDAGEPAPAPAPVRNPLGQYHGEAVQLHQMLTTPGQPVDLRQGLAAVCALLVKMTTPGEGR